MDNYQNLKKGFLRLAIGEILLIAGNIFDFINTDSLIVALIMITTALVGLILNLKGLKLVAKDDAGYKRARKWALGSLFIVIFGALLAGIVDLFNQTLGNAIGQLITAANTVCDFLATYFVLQTSLVILERHEINSLINYTKITRNAYLVTFLLKNIVYTFMIFESPVLVSMTSVLSTGADVLALLAKIMYLIFLFKMYKLL
ncbi:MAG: hypothetical protein KBT35_01115 [Firmicutes bacterium]|nr:hypothetical protein [Candidatus Colivicinus equi]